MGVRCVGVGGGVGGCVGSGVGGLLLRTCVPPAQEGPGGGCRWEILFTLIFFDLVVDVVATHNLKVAFLPLFILYFIR